MAKEAEDCHSKSQEGKSQLPPKVVFHASEVGAVCDKNKYKSIVEAFVDVWKRFRPQQFEEAQRKTGFVIEREVGARKIDSIGLGGEFNTFLIEASTTGTATEVKKLSDDFAEKVRVMPAESSSAVNQEEREGVLVEQLMTYLHTKELVKTYVESKANTNFGTRKEKRGIEILRAKYGDSVTTSDEYFSLEFDGKSSEERISADSPVFVIVGRVDGKIGDKIVIEIKNRIHAFHEPEYDLMQLETYLHIGKFEKGIFMQVLTKEREVKTGEVPPSGEVPKVKVIEESSTHREYLSDPKRWKLIVKGCASMAGKVIRFSQMSPEAHEAFLKSDEKYKLFVGV